MRNPFLVFLLILSPVFTIGQVISTFPYFEDFESGDGDWGLPNASDSLNIWELGNPTGQKINKAASGSNAWATVLDGNYPNVNLSELRSPEFNFSNSDSLFLRFKLYVASENCCDRLWVDYSTDKGSSYTLLGSFNDGQNWYNAPSQNFWSGQSGGWVIASIPLDFLKTQRSVVFRFSFISDHNQVDEGFAIDDIEITSAYNDLEISNFLGPNSACTFSNQEQISVKIQNLGTSPMSNISAEMIHNGSQLGPESVPGTIQVGGSLDYTFSSTLDLSKDTTHSIRFEISQSSDNTRVNDTLNIVVENFEEVSIYPYVEDFENGENNWEIVGSQSTWAIGEPNKNIIRNASSGEKAWVTGNIGIGQYNNDDTSFVKSPCFDLTSLSNPIISMDVWWNSERGFDGAQVQFSTNQGGNWETIGNVGSGWYTDNIAALNGPGWSGRQLTNDGSNGWVNVQSDIQASVIDSFSQMRVLFASDGSVRDEGFAFDYVRIYDQANIDVAILELSTGNFFATCLGGQDSIFAIIRNDGLNVLDTVELAIEINGGFTFISQFVNLSPNEVDTVFLISVDGLPVGSYPVVVYNVTPGDPHAFNDVIGTEIRIDVPIDDFDVLPVDTVCDSGSAVIPIPNLDLTFWYSDANRQTQIAFGDTFHTGPLSTDTTFYLERRKGSIYQVGPETRGFAGGNFSSIAADMFFQSNRYGTLTHAWVDANISGVFVAYLYRVGEEDFIDSIMVQARVGWQKVFLGFQFEPGEYRIRIDDFDIVRLFRNTEGTKYQDSIMFIEDNFSITGNSNNDEFYYYLYNWEVALHDVCVGTGTKSLVIGNQDPVADFEFNADASKVEFINKSEGAFFYSWNFGDGTKSSEVNPFHIFPDTGSYEVLLAIDGNCGADSITKTINIGRVSTLEVSEIQNELKIYPNPGNEYLKLEVQLSGTIMVYETSGKLVYKQSIFPGRNQIETSHWKQGMYIIRVFSDKGVNTKTWIKH